MTRTISDTKITQSDVRGLEAISGLGIEEAVHLLASREGLSREKAARNIYAMLEQNRLRLNDSSPPRTFLGFLRSIYSLWFWGLVSIISLTVFSIYLLPQLEPWIYFRYVLGVVYVLYLPGASLIEALYPEKGELEGLERFALSIGLSLAVSPLVGLILNYTPWGIRLDPIFTSLSLLTMALGVIGVYRKFEYHSLRLEIRVTSSRK